ncbi:MAG TPA: helix-turn-helix transcriptional regulator [Acidimicrobiales bacterium]|nr:helix-turn-helix transcriptional regulator [Acidimicrobiales bacterium]
MTGDEATGSWDAFGAYLRSQRQLANLSLRQLATLTRVSNPYLSQIERGLHQPSVGVIKSLAEALDLSANDLLAYAADIESDQPAEATVERAIRRDPRLTTAQKAALLAVYASMVDTGAEADTATDPAPGPDSSTGGRPGG